jgi:hypothetical protein
MRASGLLSIGLTLDDDPRQSAAWRCILAGIRVAFAAGEWGKKAWERRFWRRTLRYALAARYAAPRLLVLAGGRCAAGVHGTRLIRATQRQDYPFDPRRGAPSP